LPSWVNLRILLQHGAYRLTSALSPPRSKKGVQDIANQLQAPTLGVGQSDLVIDATTMPLFSLWLNKEVVRTKWDNSSMLPPMLQPTQL
jgi:hypothetical protein